jgi:hypothetical protein
MMRIRIPNVVIAALVFGPAWVRGAEPLLPADRPIAQAVDHFIDATLATDKLRPAPAADDATLLRRLSLDLVGRIPTTAEVADYLANSDPEKKIKLVDRLLGSPAFVRHQAREFATLLQVETAGRRGGNNGALLGYFQKALAENRSWDRIFREIMLPDEKDAKTQGAGEFLRSRVKDLNRLTIDVSTMFFGVNVSCAQCHDHPHVPDWKQDHFYGMKSFFARTYEANGKLAERDSGGIKFIPNKGKEKLAPVMFLTGKVIAVPGLEVPIPAKQKRGKKQAAPAKAPPAPKISLRAKLVELALEPEQREYFSRAIVNRIWHRFFGRGLVMPLDQMHSANPASHPELLQWLARDVVSHQYDLRRLIRGLVLSNAYARSSRWDGEDTPADKYFAVAQIRPLTPMQLAVSLRLAATDPEKLPKASADIEKYLENLERSAAGLAAQFVQPSDNFQVGVSEAMLFANNESLLKTALVEGPGGLVSRLAQMPDHQQRAELAIRTVLSRPAQPQEIQAIVDYLNPRADRMQAACAQVVWALVAGAEFRFNH